MALRRFGNGVRHLLHKPSRVFMVCMAFATLSLVFDGILWRLWGLSRDQDRLTNEMTLLQEDIDRLTKQLQQAEDPSFIERQARDRLDLANENDLVFVFPDEGTALLSR